MAMVADCIACVNGVHEVPPTSSCAIWGRPRRGGCACPGSVDSWPDEPPGVGEKNHGRSDVAQEYGRSGVAQEYGPGIWKSRHDTVEPSLPRRDGGVSLQVIGAGLGRTGTTSLKVALEQLLGKPCYHMLEVRERPADPDIWGDAYEGRPPSWERFFGGYGATVDWPAAPFWSEISAAFPDALILLSVRDADAWWRSASSTIFVALATYFADDAPDDGWTRMGRGMMTSFSPAWQDEASAKAATWLTTISSEQLCRGIVFLSGTPRRGGEPICARLHLDVPDEPFPHSNTPKKPAAKWALTPARRYSGSLRLGDTCRMEIRRGPPERGGIACCAVAPLACSFGSIDSPDRPHR